MNSIGNPFCAADAREPSPSRLRRFRHTVASGIAAAVAAAMAGAAGLNAPPAQALQGSVGITIGTSALTEGLINFSCALLNPLSLCVRVVTHAIVGGEQIVSERSIIPLVGGIVLNPGQAIDVTGDGRSDLSVALSVPLTLLPPGFNADKPTVRISKLSGAPPVLPVKVEIVTSDSAGARTSFGYDTRASTAPTGFLAIIDQSDRDRLPQTDQVKVNLSVSPGANRNLAMVQESFQAGSDLSEAQRTRRSIVQLGFRAAPAEDALPATQALQSATIDVTSSPGTQRFAVTSAPVSTADVLLVEPGDDPKITGSISHLPASIDLTITDTDTDGDGESDQSGFDYSGSAVVPRAQFQFSQPAEDALGTHRRTISIAARELPREVQLDYAPGPGSVRYAASERTPFVKVQGDDQRPFFERATSFTLTLEDLPRLLDAGYGEGVIRAEAYAFDAQGGQVPDRLGLLLFSGLDVPQILPPCIQLVCDDFDDPEASGFMIEDVPSHYLLFTRLFNLRSASVVTDPPPLPPPPGNDPPVFCDPDISDCDAEPPTYLDALIDTVADAGADGGQYRRFVARIRKLRDSDKPEDGETYIDAQLSQLLPMTHFVQLTGTPDGGLFAYDNAAAGSGPDIKVDAFNLDGLPKGENGLDARDLHVALDGAPSSMQFTYANGGFPLQFQSGAGSGGDDKLDLLKVRMSSAGVLDALPASEAASGQDPTQRLLDGVFLRDFSDRYVVDARVRNLQQAKIDKQAILPPDPCAGEADNLEVTVQTQGDASDPRLRYDSQVSDAFFTFPPSGSGTELVSIDETFATVDRIPNSITLRKFLGSACETRLSYVASGVVDNGLSLLERTNKLLYQNGFPVNGSEQGKYQNLGIVPLPTSLEICKSSDTQICYAGTTDPATAGSLSLDAAQRTRLTVQDLPNVGFPLNYTVTDLTFNHFALVAHAPDSGSSYIGIDTDWSGSGTPPLENTVTGSIEKQKEKFPDVERDHFVFGTGFAAADRVLSWSGTLDLVLAQASGGFFAMDRSGSVTCPRGMDILVRREAALDYFVTVNLGDDFCQ